MSLFLFPDGDECILGVMALNIRNGARVPAFFYGQRYAFALVDAGSAALFFRLFSSSILSFKMAMLFLWALGVFFVGAAIRNWAGRRAAVLGTLLLVFCPAWAMWSMKAGGGYVSAFFLTGLILYLLSLLGRGDGSDRVLSAVLGGALSILAFTQPLFLLPLVPFFAVTYLRRSRLSLLALLLAAAVVPGSALLIESRRTYEFFKPPPVFRGSWPSQALALLPRRLETHFSGAYYFEKALAATIAIHVAAILWCLTLAAAIGLWAFWGRGRRRFPLAGACVAAVVLTLASTLFMNIGFFFGCRYLLPLAVPLVILISLLSQAADGSGGYPRAVAGLLLALLVTSSALALYDFRNVRSSGDLHQSRVGQARATQALVQYLLEKKIHHVYGMLPLLPWTLELVSDLQIKGRYTDPKDRYPAYALEVDRAVAAGDPVAIVGELPPENERESAWYPFRAAGLQIDTVGDWYYVVLNPPPEFLNRIGFKLNRETVE